MICRNLYQILVVLVCLFGVQIMYAQIVTVEQTFVYSNSGTKTYTVADLPIQGLPVGTSIVWMDAPAGGNTFLLSDLLVSGSKYYLQNTENTDIGTRLRTTVFEVTPSLTPSKANNLCEGDAVSISAMGILTVEEFIANNTNGNGLDLEEVAQYQDSHYFIKKDESSWTAADNLISSIPGASMYIANTALEDQAVLNGLIAKGYLKLPGNPSQEPNHFAIWLGLVQFSTAVNFNDAYKSGNTVTDGGFVNTGWYWVDGSPISYENWDRNAAGRQIEPNDYHQNPAGSNPAFSLGINPSNDEDYAQFNFQNRPNGVWVDSPDSSSGHKSVPLFEFSGAKSLQWSIYNAVTTNYDILIGETNGVLNVTAATGTQRYKLDYEINGILQEPLIYEVIGDAMPQAPVLECWESATYNSSTCSWDVVGTQPLQPTTSCWEVATFNNTTCSWEVTGSQPIQPILECWESTMFNTTTCSWEVTGSQPAVPVTQCWESATFNTTTCLWDVAGNQPSMPTNLECWETDVFNNTSCIWEVTGTQPIQPILDCWESTIFNSTTCTWDISGSQPVQPVLECWEIATFDTTTCSWNVIGNQPTAPINLECWEVSVFNNSSCFWEISGTQPIQPVVECWETSIFNSASCTWDITGVQPIQPTVACWEVATFNNTTCAWDVSTGASLEPQINEVVSEGNNIIVDLSNSGDFQYSLDGHTYQSSNVFYNVDGGKYIVYVKQANCNNVVSIEYLHFYIPKYFTPNGDGEHDSFDLKGIEHYTFSSVTIFDRYGKLLKYAENTPFSWDGLFAGAQLPTDDYWYAIVIDNHKITGHVALKR